MMKSRSFIIILSLVSAIFASNDTLKFSTKYTRHFSDTKVVRDSSGNYFLKAYRIGRHVEEQKSFRTVEVAYEDTIVKARVFIYLVGDIGATTIYFFPLTKLVKNYKKIIYPGIFCPNVENREINNFYRNSKSWKVY